MVSAVGTTSTDTSGNTYSVVLSDDFSNGYQTSLWGSPFNGGTYWNGAFSWSSADVGVSNGELQVSDTRQADGSWTAGGFSSFKAGNTITYGTVEFDARVEQAQGTQAAILMWPASDLWPRDGEIDILETPQTVPMHSSHWEGSDGSHQYDSIFSDYDPAQTHHYKMTWLPSILTIEVDGQVVASWTDANAIPDTAMGFGAMGYVAGYDEAWLGGGPDGSTPNVVTTHIDNVVMSQWTSGSGDYAGGGGTVTPTPEPTPEPTPTPEPVPTPEPAPAPGEGKVWEFHAVSEAPAAEPTHIAWKAGDTLDLSGLAPEGHALHWEGVETATTNKAYGVWQWNDGSGLLRADVNGDSKADISIDLPDGVVLTAADLILGASPVVPPVVEQPEPTPEPTPTPEPAPGEGKVWEFHAVSEAPAAEPTHIAWKAGDTLDLSGLAPEGHALHWEGIETATTNKAYGVWQWDDGSGLLRADVNGDSKADISIDLPDGVVLTEADLVLANVTALAQTDMLFA